MTSAFALLHFLLFSTFIAFLLFPIASTSTPVTSPIAKSPRFVANLQATRVRYNAVAALVPYHRIVILAQFSIGEPPLRQLAILDTGSSLTWIQCLPCKTCNEKPLYPFFDPSKSKSYLNFTCRHGTHCEYYGECRCNSEDKAEYTVHYEDNSFAKGILATEQFVFDTSEMATLITKDITFGCAHQIRSSNKVDPFNLGVGIMGMNADSSSLVRQLAVRFSYCIGNLTDPNYKYSQLIIGQGANINLGDSTPFTTGKGLVKNYYVKLETISVGWKVLDIDMTELDIDFVGYGGVIIDSGSTLIHLHPTAFFPLRNEVKKIMSKFKLVYGDNDPRLCYEGELSEQNLKAFPAVTFQFAGDAELVLEADSMFMPGAKTNTFCMAVAKNSNYRDVSIIGIMAQQYYNVGYDLDKQTISFYRVDCEIFYV